MDFLLLKHCRQIAGITQKELSEIIGVHDSLISKIETGTIQALTTTEQKMLQAFGERGIGTEEIALLASVFDARKLKRRHR